MDTILEIDKDLLIWVNSFHADWLDPVMLLITKTTFWIPLYLFLIFLIFKKFDKDAWFILLGVALTILLADQITASILKPIFQRLRPSQDSDIQNLIHLVTNSKGAIYKGGKYGFASSHAANSFGAATFMWLLYKEKSRWILLMFLWATVLTYTRLYLGVHYPGDILVGGMIGVLCAFAGWRFYLWLKIKWSKPV